MTTNLIFILRRRWLILLVLPVVTVVLVFALSPRGTSTVVKYRTSVFIAGEPGTVGSVAVEQAATELVQADVAKDAAAILEEEPSDLEDFADPLTVKVDSEALTIGLAASDEDAKRVRPFVRAFATAFIQRTEDRLNADFDERVDRADLARARLEQQLADYLRVNAQALGGTPPDPAVVLGKQSLEQQLTTAEAQLAETQAERVVAPYRISGQEPVRRTEADKLSIPASRGVRGVMALLLSILGAIGLVALIEKINPRIDSPEDAESIVGAPVLAMVPIMRGKRRQLLERAALENFSGPFAESFRAMRSHLDFRASAEGLDRPPCVMIVSSAPTEGKSTSSAFLALSYAEASREVVVIGADFRRPTIHRLFGVANKPGLSTRLMTPSSDERTEDLVRSIVKRDPRTGVRVIPSGPATDRVTGLLGDLSAVTSAALDSGCTVVIDTAPIMVANDAMDFLPMVDWVIVVVRVGSTTVRSLRQTIASLELNEAKVVGSIMVGSLESSDAKRYYYSYYKVDEETRGAIVGAQAAFGADRSGPDGGPPDGPGDPGVGPTVQPADDVTTETR